MHQHQFFNLYLHDTAELEEKLQTTVVERVTLHQWPLSCVERLRTAAEQQWIYKTQFGPTVEPSFYTQARSGLLIAAETLPEIEAGHVAMLFEFVSAPLLKDVTLSADEVVSAGQRLSAEIAAIEGDPPYYWDIGTEQAWAALMARVFTDLTQLYASGAFKVVDQALVCHLEQGAFSQDVLATLTDDVGLVHHDLSGDNIFILPDGYRVIDWQRPLWGPRKLDLANLLTSMGLDPWPHVGAGIVWLMHLLQIAWLTECSTTWFPAGHEGYDQAIARLGVSIGRLA